MGSCSLCTLRRECGGTHPVLYAGNPLLRTRLTNVLQAHGVHFQEREGLFFFPERDEPQGLADLLRAHLSEPEKDDLRIGSSDLGGLIGAERFSSFQKKVDTTWFEHALRADLYRFHFQPIVDLAGMSVHAHECLVRLFADRAYSGGEIIEAAISRGRTHVFDAYCRQKAIREASQHVDLSARLFVNFLPSSIYDPAYCLQSTLATVRECGIPPGSIVFEVVESEQIRSLKQLRVIRDFYRANGFGFALDDVGAGSNSLQMVADFQPDYIKLDKSLTSDLKNVIRVAAIRKLVELAGEFGIAVIAEGVETAGQAAILADAGIRLMQGWFFGRPAADGISAASLTHLSAIMNAGSVPSRVRTAGN